MKNLKTTFIFVFLILCFSSGNVRAQIIWDFEDGDDHGFTLGCLIPALPAADDPLTAGDEELTGGWEVDNPENLPEAGVAWVVASPAMFFGLLPGADPDHARTGAGGTLDYLASDKARVGDENTGSLNTYLLNMHGDWVHDSLNDQIATSPPVRLGENAVLTASSWGGGGTNGPMYEDDSHPEEGYTTGSCGIAVLKASDKSFLDSLFTDNKSVLSTDTKDLSAYAGEIVIFEVVDAFAGGWGWLAFDEIQITNATLYVASDGSRNASAKPEAIKQNYPNPFNKSTTIEYSVSKNTQTEITVYNIIGHKVATLVNEYKNIGSYTVTWDASELDAGVYIYQLKTDYLVESKTMKLVK